MSTQPGNLNSSAPCDLQTGFCKHSSGPAICSKDESELKIVLFFTLQFGHVHSPSDSSVEDLCLLQKCGYDLQESKMLSLSTRHHDYGRQSRDDAQGYYSEFRSGAHDVDDTVSSGYDTTAQSGLGMFDRMNLGDDISEGDEEEDSQDDSSDEEQES